MCAGVQRSCTAGVGKRGAWGERDGIGALSPRTTQAAAAVGMTMQDTGTRSLVTSIHIHVYIYETHIDVFFPLNRTPFLE